MSEEIIKVLDYVQSSPLVIGGLAVAGVVTIAIFGVTIWALIKIFKNFKDF